MRNNAAPSEAPEKLVAKALPRQNMCVAQFPTMGHRAFWAWQCLERDELGQPPHVRVLERTNELANNSLRRLIRGETVRPSRPQLERMAKALGTTADWLEFGRGEGPASRWPIPSYPYGRNVSAEAREMDRSVRSQPAPRPQARQRRR